jgi:3-phytase
VVSASQAEAPAAPGAVTASLETPALFDDEAGGDADADDPAIWVHPSDPAASVVIATKKNAGLSVYDLKGRELQAIAPPAAPGEDDAGGRFNNVDVVYGFALGKRRVDIAVVTDRGRDQLRTYVIDPKAARCGDAPLVDVTATDVPFAFNSTQAEVNEQRTAYGIAATALPHGGAYVFASRRSTTQVGGFVLVPTRDGRVTYRKVYDVALPNEFELPNGAVWSACQDDDGVESQVEGMVVDSERGVLYMGQEDIGIWALSFRSGGLRLVDKVREFGVPYDRFFEEEEEEFACELRDDLDPGFGGDHLSADVEGLTVYYGKGSKGYLLASSQGDNTFAVYERKGKNAYLGGFALVDGPKADGNEECDGAMVVNVPLGADFPLGLFVAQDGDNGPAVLDADGEERSSTNFKFVPWERIAGSFDRQLLIDTRSYAPRR